MNAINHIPIHKFYLFLPKAHQFRHICRVAKALRQESYSCSFRRLASAPNLMHELIRVACYYVIIFCLQSYILEYFSSPGENIEWISGFYYHPCDKRDSAHPFF